MTIEEVREHIMDHLAEIAPLFTEDARLTFIMHVPGQPKAEMLITTGEVIDILETVKRTMARVPSAESVRRI